MFWYEKLLLYYIYVLLLVKRLKLLHFVARSLTPELCIVYPLPQTTFTVCRKRDWRNRIFEVTFDCPARPWPSLIVPQSRGIRRKNPSANTTAGTLSQIRQKMWQLTICHISPEEEGKYSLVTKSVCKAACHPCETTSLLMVNRLKSLQKENVILNLC